MGGRDTPGHGGLVMLTGYEFGQDSDSTSLPDKRRPGHPDGPGPPKINEALVPPNPKEFDST